MLFGKFFVYVFLYIFCICILYIFCICIFVFSRCGVINKEIKYS